MDLPEILNFESLLPKIVYNKKYVRSETKRLTAAGDNYASVALAIDIFLENENSEEEVVHTVAKLLPSSEFMHLFMNISFTVRNELAFYQTIIPTLRHFQTQQGSPKSLEFFPKFYGGRLNLDPSVKTLDNNVVILMENLKTAGYGLLERTIGFDLHVTKLILERMAELHSTFLALKQLQPEIFEEKLKPYFDEFTIFQMDENEYFMTSEIIVDTVMGILQEDELCVLYIEKIRPMIRTCIHNLGLPKNTPKFGEDVFASLIHDDLWVNNIMVKTHLSKVVDVKFLDWQLYEYASVTKDILFFLCTSAEESVFKDCFDDLFKFYHEKFVENLKELQCDTEKYSFGVFQKELQLVATEIGYFYVMIALPSIFAVGDHVWEVHELNKHCFLGQVQEISEVCRNRICFITRKFIQKGWI